jgi:isoleucyl-tRNA synthetase
MNLGKSWQAAILCSTIFGLTPALAAETGPTHTEDSNASQRAAPQKNNNATEQMHSNADADRAKINEELSKLSTSTKSAIKDASAELSAKAQEIKANSPRYREELKADAKQLGDSLKSDAKELSPAWRDDAKAVAASLKAGAQELAKSIKTASGDANRPPSNGRSANSPQEPAGVKPQTQPHS